MHSIYRTLILVVSCVFAMSACGGHNGPPDIVTSTTSTSSTSSTLSSTTTTTVLLATLKVFAGNVAIAQGGKLDGSGANASFSRPNGLASDSSGNLYVADSGNNSIRKITSAGVVSTLVGTGTATDSNDVLSVSGIATDTTGNIYIADSKNNVIKVITSKGIVATIAGSAGIVGHSEGVGAAASFSRPNGIAVDTDGNLYVADSDNSTIRKISPDGTVSTLAGTAGMTGSADGTQSSARFDHPTGIAIDTKGNIYVTDTLNSTIRKISSDGVVSTLAGTVGSPSSADGTGAAAGFNKPSGITTDKAGIIYVADNGNSTIRRVTSVGAVTTIAGTAGTFSSNNGTGQTALFNGLKGIATDAAGNVYVTETANNTIRKITPSKVVTTLAGSASASGHADGTGTAATFSNPLSIANDSAGNIYVADSGNFLLRKITPDGVVTTLAGTAGINISVDGSGTAAGFHDMGGIAVDRTGNIYVAESVSGIVRKITLAGVVTTLAGSASGSGSADGSGTAAQFNSPRGMATDSTGNVYVSDSLNATIRKITPAGVVSTFAGTAGVTGAADDTGTAASFTTPCGLATDNADNVYVADCGNQTIRKITPAGVVTTLAGKASVPGNNDDSGSAARFSYPESIATDAAGNVYVADKGDNNTIRKITPDRVVTTLAGVPGQVGFVGGTLPGSLSAPGGMAVSGKSLYITLGNGVVVINNLQ